MLRKAFWQKASRVVLAAWFALLFAAGVPVGWVMIAGHAPEVTK
jgi:hypothetical protein